MTTTKSDGTRITPVDNRRMFFAVTFKTRPKDAWHQNGDASDVPGYIRPNYFVYSIQVLTAYDAQRDGDRGQGYTVIRTGWDNVHADGCVEETIPLPGIHYRELPQDEQKGIASYSRSEGLSLSLDMEQWHIFPDVQNPLL